MALKIAGPEVGDSIGHMQVLDDQGNPVTLAEIPGTMLVVDVFRGHW